MRTVNHPEGSPTAERVIDAVVSAGCFLVGCHVDRDQNVINGPTVGEHWESGLFALATPLPISGGGLNTLKPGPFANESLPARGPDRSWTQLEVEEIDRIGSTYGCHTCGTQDPGAAHFVPDHQPPSALNFNNDPQRLYPHCLACSRRQGGQVVQYLRRVDME